MNIKLYKKMCNIVRISPYREGKFLLHTNVKRYTCHMKLTNINSTILCNTLEQAHKIRRVNWFEPYIKYVKSSPIFKFKKQIKKWI